MLFSQYIEISLKEVGPGKECPILEYFSLDPPFTPHHFTLQQTTSSTGVLFH